MAEVLRPPTTGPAATVEDLVGFLNPSAKKLMGPGVRGGPIRRSSACQIRRVHAVYLTGSGVITLAAGWAGEASAVSGGHSGPEDRGRSVTGAALALRRLSGQGRAGQ